MHSGIQGLNKRKRAGRQAQDLRKTLRYGHNSRDISHRINNPLTAVIGYIFLNLNIETDKLKNGHLREALNSAKRIEQTVKDILAFARTYEIKRETVNLENLIDNILKNPSLKESKRIRIIKKPDEAGNTNLDRELIKFVITKW